MKAKDYLVQIRRLDTRIKVMIEELSALKALATKTTSVMGGDRVQTSGNQQKMADCVVKIIDAERRINDEIDRLVDSKMELLNLIECYCDPDCMKLLYKRYFSYESWEEIAVEMKFTYKWVSGGLHQRALDQLQCGIEEKKRNEKEKRGMSSVEIPIAPC